MYCTNCEFEIKGAGRKECPVCGGPLVEYSELEISLDESKSDSETEKLEETTEESKEPAFFDLESALNTDDDVPSFLTQETGHVFKRRSREDILANPLKKPDPIEELVTAASNQSELKQKRSSKLLPAIVVIGVLVVAVNIGGIFLLKSQQKLNPLIAQLKKETEKTVEKILNTVMRKGKEKSFVKKEPELAGDAQTAQKEISQKKTDSVKEITPPVIVKKDVQISQVKVPPKSSVKKKKDPVKSIEKKISSRTIYSIHAGSYRTKKTAVSESNRLKQLGFDAYVQTTDLQKGQIWHRVKIGNFSARKDAQKVQKELRQKDSKLKSVIVKRKAKSRKILIKQEEKKSIAMKKPVPVGVSQPVQRKTSKQKPDAIKTTPPINETIKADEEQPVTEMETASSVSQPVEGEMVQRETDSVERTLPIEEKISTDEEQPFTEMEVTPDISQPVQEEISQQKPDAVKTVSAVKPEKDDQSFAVNVSPESTAKKEKETVKPAEEKTPQKVFY